MTSQAVLKALTTEQLARLGELDELADTADGVADLASITADQAIADYAAALDARDAACELLEQAQARADDTRRAAAAFRRQMSVVRTASGYLTEDEARRLYQPAPGHD